jgi:hypothetical protein
MKDQQRREEREGRKAEMDGWMDGKIRQKK